MCANLKSILKMRTVTGDEKTILIWTFMAQCYLAKLLQVTKYRIYV